MKRTNIHRQIITLALMLAGSMSGGRWASAPVVLARPPQVVSAWSNTGSLNTARSSHTATLLSNSKVLVVGGSGGGIRRILNSSELYDPATGKWIATGDLHTARSGHTATLLPNGKVLVAGGLDGETSLTISTELYDPETETWSIAGNLSEGRVFHTATLLQSGKVLVAGGENNPDDLIDGFSTNSAELYDPNSETWNITGRLIAERSFHTATLLQDGNVLAAGGAPVAELYDADTGTWSKTGNLRLRESAEAATATLLTNGKVLFAGAWNGFSSINSVELYDPATGTWSISGSLNAARSNHTSTLLPSGKVLTAGGCRLTHTELYDPDAGTWTITGILNTPRGGHTATLLTNGKVLVAGGDSNGSAELYTPTAPSPIPRITNASVAGKKLFVVGENFDAGAVILLNGEEQKTRNDEQNPVTTLIGKKAGNKIKLGDKLQVRNPNGTLSAEFTFSGS